MYNTATLIAQMYKKDSARDWSLVVDKLVILKLHKLFSAGKWPSYLIVNLFFSSLRGAAELLVVTTFYENKFFFRHKEL